MSSGFRVFLLSCVVSGLSGCAGEVIEVPPEGVDEPSASGGARSGGTRSPEPVQYPSEPEPASGGSSGGMDGAGGGAAMGGQTSGGPDSFTLTTLGVAYEPSTSEFEPGVTTYLLHLGPTNTNVVAVMGGEVIETGVTGLLEVKLSDCAEQNDPEEVCLLRVVQFGGSPAGTDADPHLTGYSFRSDFEGTATKTPDGWSATLYPEGLMLDMNKITDEGASSYHGVFVSQVTFDCTSSTCNVRAHAM